MSKIIIISFAFPDYMTANSARRILTRLGINPIAQGGRHQDGWLHYPLAEETSTIPSSRQEIPFGECKLRVGISK